MTTMSRLRSIPSWQVTLGVALLGARLPDRGPARLGGPAGPIHDPGADAAGRDRGRAPGAAGRPQGQDPPAARADPGRRGAGRGSRPTWSASSTTQLEAGADRRRPHPADRDRHRPPARGLAGSRSRRMASEADYLVGSRDIRAVVEELWLRRRRGDRGQRRAGHADHRRSSTSAASLLVNSAYLAPPYQVTALGPDGPVRPPERVARASSTSSGRAARGVRHPGLVRRAGRGGHARLRRDRDPALLAAHRLAVGRSRRCHRAAARCPDDASDAEPADDRGRRLRARPARRRPAALAGGRRGPRTAVVAGPDRPGRQPQRAQRPAATRGRPLERELATLDANRSRGDVSVDEITADLRRVRA